MDTLRLYQYVGGFRRKRMARFIARVRPTPETTILDVGGYSGFWAESGVSSKITILRPEGPENLPPGTPPNISSVRGDGCDLRDHGDQAFDLVFSNSVIEHVGDETRQRAFANAAMRVGRSVWVQTPAFEFPFEPHFLTPFIHWFPERLQSRLLPWTVWALLQTTKPTPVDFRAMRVRLLSRRGLLELFPRADIITERFLGLPKSHIAHLPGAR